MIPKTVKISVIVTTRDRAASLKRLLASFDALEQSDHVSLELLIVDNGSSDSSKDVVLAQQVKSLKYDLKFYVEPMRGQSSAINCGLRHCRGEIICLVDDDVVMDPRWITGILASYELNQFDALQGRILPGVDPQGYPADLNRLYYYNIPIVDHGDEMKAIRGLTGAHMTFRRAVYERVGFFNVKLGPGASGFSGDTEFSRRISAAGFRLGYTPHAIVYHELSPLRYGRKYNRAVQYRKGLSRSVYRRDSIAFSVLPKLVLNCLRFSFYLSLGSDARIYRTEGRIWRFVGYLVGQLRRGIGKAPMSE